MTLIADDLFAGAGGRRRGARMTYCDLGCRRPADILHGRQKLCAHHYLTTDVGRQLGGER